MASQSLCCRLAGCGSFPFQQNEFFIIINEHVWTWWHLAVTLRVKDEEHFPITLHKHVSSTFSFAHFKRHICVCCFLKYFCEDTCHCCGVAGLMKRRHNWAPEGQGKLLSDSSTIGMSLHKHTMPASLTLSQLTHSRPLRILLLFSQEAQRRKLSAGPNTYSYVLHRH